MIDGLDRETAEGITVHASNNSEECHSDAGEEYAFQFEDSAGKVHSSFDFGLTVRAFTEKEAWDKAEEMINNDVDIEAENVISIKKIS